MKKIVLNKREVPVYLNEFRSKDLKGVRDFLIKEYRNKISELSPRERTILISVALRLDDELKLRNSRRKPVIILE